ncbi:hypothetical protein BDB00DRAFT_849353 [Zychaea mexicana]|uniref:uncharacterized protein n=1 Tax=Zychaea mexicana TaxID=64656 RepID=UPI0022FEA57C|nr:uncharacterized protein BDB00DRAFT_849353 [Zychaea mexicana]KAI9488209.1 hypothetical protein BDB00DRAFT_849353 [Zychaea mexicana]
MSVIIVLFLIAASSFLIALFLQCPTMETFLTMITNTPSLDDKSIRNLIPIQQQIGNALLRARVIALGRQQSVLEIYRRIHVLDVTFYGFWGKWYVWGQHHPVITGLRDGAPLLDYIFRDASMACQLAKDWQAAERALVRPKMQDDIRPLEMFQRIAEQLCQVKSPVANIDAALALHMAWQASEAARCYEQAIACLISLVRLVEHSIDYDPIVRWLQLTVADILYKKRYEHTLEIYRQVIGRNVYDEKYYRSIGQIARILFHDKQYETVISHTGQVLRYYRNQIDIDTEQIGHVALARIQAQLILKQWKEMQHDRSWMQYFCAADGGQSPELTFVGRLHEAWADHNVELYELAVREYDRHNPMSDEQIDLFLSVKARILKAAPPSLIASALPPPSSRR